MTKLLLGAPERLSPRVRRGAVAVGALLALGVATAALTLTAPQAGPQRRHPAHRPAAAGSSRPSLRRPPAPVSTAAMREARRVAARFLGSYLPFAYGRGSVLAIRAVTAALRRELLRDRAELTPVERRRRPRVMSLQAIGATPAFVVATAVIDDGGVTTYRLRFTLEREVQRWAVSSVEEG